MYWSVLMFLTVNNRYHLLEARNQRLIHLFYVGKLFRAFSHFQRHLFVVIKIVNVFIYSIDVKSLSEGTVKSSPTAVAISPYGVVMTGIPADIAMTVDVPPPTRIGLTNKSQIDIID